MGRYFDEANAVVYHEQAVPVYGLFFVIFLLALMLTCRWALKIVSGK
jgi:hypothetical protein